MSLDFSNVPAEQFEFNRKVLARMRQSADAGDTIIQYGGGFTILRAYEQWQDGGCAGHLIVFKTKLGAELAQYVETWLNINASSAVHVYGRDSDELNSALAQLKYMGAVSCQALASERAAETYQGWQDNNRNTPVGITEEELRLAYASEVLQFALELWDMQHETRTLH